MGVDDGDGGGDNGNDDDGGDGDDDGNGSGLLQALCFYGFMERNLSDFKRKQFIFLEMSGASLDNGKRIIGSHCNSLCCLGRQFGLI